MRPRPLLWFVVSVVCLVGAYWCWRWATEWEAQRRESVSAVALGSGVQSVSNAAGATVVSPALAGYGLLTAAGTNGAVAVEAKPFPYRLSNTPKSVGQLLREDGAVLLENAVVDT